MEKFALLNLLKALDGLKSAQQTENSSDAAPTPPAAAYGQPNANAQPADSSSPQTFKTPNFMYEAILRHEQVSNRLKNKRNA